MERIPLTHAGFNELEAELKKLKAEDRPAVIDAIDEARKHGDLKENAEYHSAREKQGFIEGRIKELETIISRAEVIDHTKFDGEKIRFGATITVADVETDEETTYQIVGKPEADITRRKISIDSPMAKSLIGKETGDDVQVQAPGGVKEYEIVEVLYIAHKS